MADDNNIKNFTATDIDKYRNGQLSAQERHALEKAALDDPFLADALEGYSVSGLNIQADIAELKRRLEEKTEQAKVIPMNAGGRSSFSWLRAAIMIVLVAGAGLLAYQFLFKASNKNNEIALSPSKNDESKTEKSTDTLQQDNKTDSLSDKLAKNTSDYKSAPGSTEEAQKVFLSNANESRKVTKDSVTTNSGLTTTNPSTLSAPVKDLNEKVDDSKNAGIAKQNNNVSVPKTDIALKGEKDTKDITLKKPALADADGVVETRNKAKEEVVANGYATNKRNDNASYSAPNYFRGKVTDANNNALPFANITNTHDNVGTYSDAQGNFTLLSGDSVMNVQVRSLGFQNKSFLLQSDAGTNRIALKEDQSLNAKIIDTVKRNLSRAGRNNTMTFEEPEPADGWDSYSSYLVNNLNVPESLNIKQTDEVAQNVVEVSFEVSKNGDPVNLKVERSLCDKCDKEAMRVIKEGPKWVRKAKKGKRTTVAVPFIKPE